MSVSSELSAEQRQLFKAIAKFSTKFCNEVAKVEKGKNFIVSPYSIETLLALLTLGTTGKAQDELLTTLSFKDDSFIRANYGTITKRLTSIKGVTLDIANKIYVMKGNYALSAEFEKDSKNIFDAEVDSLNFCKSEEAADCINHWVESKTHDRIKKLISLDDLGEDTRLVLVNAIYFKGSWKTKFNAAQTLPSIFYVDSRTTNFIPMMSLRGHKFKFSMSGDLDAALLELPYEGDEASMVFILPNRIDGLKNLQEKISNNSDHLLDAMAAMYQVELDVVSIPTFKIETELGLNDILKSIGIKQIFNSCDSGLTGLMMGDDPLYVSHAIQKAFIEVNEEGAEAAAASAMLTMMTTSLNIQSIQFIANRPFMFALVAKGCIVFSGVFSLPKL